MEQCATSALKTTELNVDECKIESRPSLLREVRQVTTSLPCWARVWNPKKSAGWGQRELSHRWEHVCKLTSCRWAGKCPRFNPLPATWECTTLMVQSVAGALKARGSNNEEEFMRKRTRWLTRRLLMFCAETVDGNVVADMSPWQESERQCPSILHRLWLQCWAPPNVRWSRKVRSESVNCTWQVQCQWM